MSPSRSGVQLRWAESKRTRAPAISNEQWAQCRDEICRLHAGMKLDDLMLYIRAQYNFCPSKHQLVLQLHKWGCRKYKSKGEPKSATTNTTTPKPVEAGSTSIEISANVQDKSVTTESTASFGDWEDLDDSFLDLSHAFAIDDNFSFVPPLPPSRIINDESSDTRLSETVRTIERELENVFEAYTEQDMTVDDQVQDPNALSREDNSPDHSVTTSQDGSGSLSPSRSLRLQRVPRAQKRPRSISSLTSAQDSPKKNKFHSNSEHLLKGTEIFTSSIDFIPQSPLSQMTEQSCSVLYDPDRGQVSLSPTCHWQGSPESQTLSQASSAMEESVYNFDGSTSSLGTMVSPDQLETSNVDLGSSDISDHSQLTRLLTRARKGQVLCAQDDTNTSRVSRLAWFFFGAGLYEEAFVLHLMVYKTMQTAPAVSESMRFSHLVNLARCSKSEGQIHIVKDLLLKASRKRHTGREGDPMENFLLHSFLTLMYRKQDNLSKADHHCHRAIHWYKQAQKEKPVCNKWHSLSIVAWTLLRSNVTEKRLQMKTSKITNSVRHKVCAKASDQLIVRHWSSQVLNGTRHALDNLVTRKSSGQSSSLRTLFEWCLQVIENHPWDLDKHQIWRRTRAAGMNLRTLGMTTLYCQLWKAWQHEITTSSLAYKFSDYWSSTIETELGINPSECLATIPDAITMTWPSLDEDIPMLANWRTYQHELHKRAIGSLKDLVELSDTQLAYHFFRSYSAHCIASSKDGLENIAFGKTHRECVISFANENSDLLLPSLALHEHVGDAKAAQPVATTQENAESLCGNITECPVSRSSINKIERPVSGEGPVLALRAYRASMRSADSLSIDLASMKSIQRRVRERGLARKMSDAESMLPPRGTGDMDAMSIDDLVDLTRRSMRSMSLHETIDPADADSLMRLLSSSLAQQDVTVY